METLLHDLRFAARQLGKDKGFLIVAGLTLALTIGANTTIFSVVNSVILKPLDLPQPERVVTMWNAYPGAVSDGGARGANGAPDYFDRRALTEVFEEVAAFRYRGRSIDLEGVPQRIDAREVTPSFFGLLGAAAAHGRTFSEEEGEPGNEQVTVLRLWARSCGSMADPTPWSESCPRTSSSSTPTSASGPPWPSPPNSARNTTATPGR